jgi:micrococcal nuclease
VRRLPLLALIVAVVAALLSAGGSGEDGRPAGTGTGAGGAAGAVWVGRVVRVVDGDTIHVQLGGRREKVRYIGVDTPESVKPGSPVECFGKEASRFNARLVAGRRVRLVRDAEERDRYGRLLAYVYRADDGVFVNARLVRDGYATALTIPPNVRFAERFRRQAAEARRAGRGLWSACEQ